MMHAPVLKNSGVASALYMPRLSLQEELHSEVMSAEFPIEWDCDGCPPPEFMLPPPPKPHWLADDSQDCRSTSDLVLLETCDNMVIIDAAFQDSFSSISVILICSLLLVVTLLLTSFMIFRRRKNSNIDYPHENNCHQITDHSIVYDEDRRSSTPVSGKQRIVSALNSIKRNHVNNSTDSTCHLDSHFPNSTSLPNHYIHDTDRQARIIDPIAVREFQTRFATDSSVKRVQLSDRPPPLESEESMTYPHILIGGQPFYLIPSKPEETHSYAYATMTTGRQDIHHPSPVMENGQPPIYEEIDRYYYSNSIGSGVSDRGEVGSLNRSDPSSDDGTHHLHPGRRFPRGHLPRRSPSNSVYYYSDTLRKPEEAMGPVQQKCFRINNKLSDDSDSGISNRSLAPTPKSSDSKNSNTNNNNNNILPIHETRVVILSENKERGRPAEV
ncbi:uncharacterized protein [Lepeophtheirus salmonis]|uniref:uncharacterized protein n=1 Tax=Lepeophtheirus salmonis TaxID=72036 RepID=UPI001AE0F9FF|nr:uncharacterized protein LOC121130307 [Lepeophtheirus salmonis]